jgi:hypothetical protein
MGSSCRGKITPGLVDVKLLNKLYIILDIYIRQQIKYVMLRNKFCSEFNELIGRSFNSADFRSISGACLRLWRVTRGSNTSRSKEKAIARRDLFLACDGQNSVLS